MLKIKVATTNFELLVQITIVKYTRGNGLRKHQLKTVLVIQYLIITVVDIAERFLQMVPPNKFIVL